MRTIASRTVRILLLLPFLCFAQRNDSSSYSFVVLADPQFGMMANDSATTWEASTFQKAITAINKLRPAFVVVCGDLVNSVGDSTQIAEYQHIAAMLNPSITLYNVPGNHDIGNTPTDGTLSAYRSRLGPDRYSFVVQGTTFIVLNTPILKDSSRVPHETAAQRTWLESTLAQAQRINSPVVIFQHHPWFLQTPDEPDGYFTIDRSVRQQYLALLQRHGVTHIFAGHYHRNAIGFAGSLEMITTAPVGKPLGKDPSGMRMVSVSPKGITHRYYGLEEVPAHGESGTSN